MQYESLAKIFYKNNTEYKNIYSQRFFGEFTYRYDFMIGKEQAFLVMPLETLNLISAVLQLDKRLSRVIAGLPEIAMLQFTRKCIVDEIKLTNEIEGVFSTRKEIQEIIAMPDNKKRKRLTGLVNKYLLLVEQQPIELKSCGDIRKLYDEFILDEIEEEDPQNLPDGEFFRKAIVEIVSSSQKVLHQGLYPEKNIISSMTAALEELNGGKMNHLVKIAVFHYMFGYIHPFYDGNGRMARFISSYLLKQTLEPIVALSLSYTIKKNLKKYYDMFRETNDYKNKGDLTPFVIAFLEMLKESVENLCLKLEEKAEQFNFYTEKIKKYENSDKQFYNVLFILVQNSLFSDEGIGIETLSSILSVSPSTVRAQIKKARQELLFVDQSGRMKLYDINLDALAKL